MERPSLSAAHPWHGVDPGADFPSTLTAFIEIVPTDTVKYELDKATGILKVDRPQLFSNVCPSLYGFVPRTFCDARVARLCEEKTGRSGLKGDGDPMDVCVLTEKPITHAQILLLARPIGGLRMLDHDEVDDKILAVMKGDAVYGGLSDVAEMPKPLVDRLRHYFLTYKQTPDRAKDAAVEITHVYGRDDALAVLSASREDYRAHFGS
ncbi:MAG TPA: inorganic pyrophosphatase [Thermoanaerobaculia bacterium]|nr:inorganic pyrophosphatase [Thermoanaerobaculia bacterium]